MFSFILNNKEYLQVHTNNCLFSIEKEIFEPCMLRHLHIFLQNKVGRYRVWTVRGSWCELSNLEEEGKLVVLGIRSAFLDMTEFEKDEKYVYRKDGPAYLIDLEHDGRLVELDRALNFDALLRKASLSMPPKDKDSGEPESTHFIKEMGRSRHKDTLAHLQPVSLCYQEVRTHDSKQDAWIIFDQQVYDVTKYLHIHPGGINFILSNAGRDITGLIERTHSWVNVPKLLEKWRVGWID